MKTINELNSKVWFRALKVIYIAFVILCYGIAISSSVAFYITAKESNDEFQEEQQENRERLTMIEDLKSKGYNATEIQDTFKNKYSPYGMLQITREQYKAIYGEEEYNKLDIPMNTPPNPQPSVNMKWILLIVPGSIFLAWLTAQLVKWIFYYVILGKIKPPKGHESN